MTLTYSGIFDLHSEHVSRNDNCDNSYLRQSMVGVHLLALNSGPAVIVCALHCICVGASSIMPLLFSLFFYCPP
jgi:hypothetical protein